MAYYYSTAKILELREENYRVRSFVLDCAVKAKPGQFVMVWLPRLDEKPMCVVNDDPLTLCIANVGPFTQKLFELKQGDKLSFRGPYGNNFWFGEGTKKILLVGGGYGVAALNFLAKQAIEKKIEATMIVAARKKEDAILKQAFLDKGVEMLVSTDDGSEGFKGRAHELAKTLLQQGKYYDCVYAVGPEKMMETIARACAERKVPCQISLERYMGCGVGVCGKCDAGGKIVCGDGPVVTGEEAFKLAEFGKTHRDTMGHKHEW